MKKIYIFLILCIIFIINGYLNKENYEKVLRKKKIEPKYNPYKNKKNIDNKFYELDIFPELKQIKLHKDQIRIEVTKSLENNLEEWTDWPEKYLYTKEHVWKIMPFYYYGTWVNKNCEKMPELTKFLRKLPNLRIALLSILSPNTVLTEHKGWGSHSNNVLRCHYGILVPHNCYIGVKNEGDVISSIQPHAYDEWIIFDDSKRHFAANNSKFYRVVLIVDLKRPKYIKKGESEIGDTKELLEIIDYFKQNNIEVDNTDHPMKNHKREDNDTKDNDTKDNDTKDNDTKDNDTKDNGAESA
jgi:beta-hydroxylase